MLLYMELKNRKHKNEMFTTTVKFLTHAEWLISIVNKRTDDLDEDEAVLRSLKVKRC